MLDIVASLVPFLSQDVGVAEISARIGRVKKEEKPPLALDLAPKLKGVKEASLTRYRNGDPFMLDLDLSPSARPTLAALRERFGQYEAAPIRFENPVVDVLFYQPPGPHWRVVVIARLDTHAGNIQDSDKAVAIGFRRDPVGP